MKYRYTSPMPLKQIIAVLDAMLNYVVNSENEKEFLRQQIQERDETILKLQAELTTCVTVLATDETESAVLHAKLTQLWDKFFPGDLDRYPQIKTD